MPGLVPGIHVFVSTRRKDVDGRDKPGHDGAEESVHSKCDCPALAGRARVGALSASRIVERAPTRIASSMRSDLPRKRER
ncbi:hypothetical protein DXU07_37315 [Bradyrhizobium elkanii]